MNELKINDRVWTRGMPGTVTSFAKDDPKVPIIKCDDGQVWDARDLHSIRLYPKSEEETKQKNLSNDCRHMACMECGEADCGCSCHGIGGLDPIPKEPIVELLRLLLRRHHPCRHGSPLANCAVGDWMHKNKALLRGLKPSKE